MKENKLDTLLRLEGISEGELFRMLMDSMRCPGICLNEGCDYTIDVEPDSDSSYCEECGTNTVKSSELLILGL